MPHLRLHSGTRNASSWAMRAWLALREAGVEFEEVVVDIRRPQRFAGLADIGHLTPAGSVPVLEVEGSPIFDSLAIMEYANELSGERLLPTDRGTRAHARSLVAWQHAGLSRICRRISFESAFYPLRRGLTESEAAEGDRLFAHLEPILRRIGGPFLFGAVSLADFALAPTVVRLARHAPDLTRWPAVERWFAAVLEQSGVAAWLAEADRLPHVWDDEYLLPGINPNLVACGERRAGDSIGAFATETS